MIASGTESIAERLERLRAGSPDLDAIALVSVEGLPIASSIGDDLHAERLGAMTAAMLALGERIAAELRRGQLNEVMIRGDDGYAVLMTLDQNSVLCALASDEAKLGLVYLDMRRVLSEMRRRD